jgi:hypothetical protein
MRPRTRIVAAFTVAMVLASLAPARTGTAQAAPGCSGALLKQALLPDLQTVVPKHLAIQNTKRQEFLRFTNGIAKRGSSPLRLMPAQRDGTTDAVQELLDANGNVACAQIVSSFEFHLRHKDET